MSGATPHSLWDNWASWWVGALSPARWVPGNLTQPILPGWSFGPNLTINETNSSSPATEVSILQEQSYGRQLGRLGEALEAVLENVGIPEDPRVERFLQMQHQIADIKDRAAEEDVARLRAALDRIEKTHPEAYDTLIRDLADRLRVRHNRRLGVDENE